ncbi:MFS transporter [Microbaculum marinisediminis]|uniref:MFS transporter n=1 Tax=Microbaculum marinisediminis TaxID=2931392 RepID=A0AAW5QQW1_9HYPH|nr:MFS transporter [Microbaculum sp. A6E488]MCT8970476.1 MFS transporter [Microbaculum sp. A6E488]
MAAVPDQPYEKRWRALVGISILCFVVFVDFTVVNTILPGIQRDLRTTNDQLQWVMNAFFLMLVVFMVTNGRLGDIYGRRKALYIGVVVFAIASFVAGAAPSAEVLIACRFVQGICGAALLTCSIGLVNHHFPEAERGRALAVFMSVTGFGMAVGPLIGGVLMSALSWRWAFYVNVPVVVVGFLVAFDAVIETPPQTGEKVDWLGLAFLTPGMAGLVVAIMKANEWGWASPLFLATAAAAIVLLAVFFVVERRVAFPIIDFALFGNRVFLACTVVALTLGGFIGLGSFMAPQYLQTVRGEAPYVAGLMLLPISALVVVVPPLIGRLADEHGPMRFIALGQVGLVLSALAQIFFAPDSAVPFVLFGLGLFGLGWGLQQATATLAATAPFPTARASVVIGVLYSIWNVGSSLALAIGGLIFEVLDKASLDAALAAEAITLTDADRHVVASLLSDPSQATTALGALTPGLEEKILPLFRDAFMAGYHGAMWYLLITCAVGAVLVPLIARGGRARAA